MFSLLPYLDPVGECSPPHHVQAMQHARASPPLPPAVFLNQQTESNHDTALTIASAGGHDDLVQVLLAKGSEIEHRDKKGSFMTMTIFKLMMISIVHSLPFCFFVCLSNQVFAIYNL